MHLRLEINELSYSYGSRSAIKNVSLNVDNGEFVGIVGPNGSGKTTVLKNVYRALRPDSGNILLDGKSLALMSHRASAQKMAVVGQENEMPFDFTAEEMVGMGRSPYKRVFELDNAHDKAIVKHALEHMGLDKDADRSFSELSGGEKQRVIIARAIAQESDIFILDEPTNHLDINYQMQIFQLIKRLKVTVLAAIHDLNMAALFCDRLYFMKDGQVVLTGTPAEVLTADHILEIYGVKADVKSHPVTNRPCITFLPETIQQEEI